MPVQTSHIKRFQVACDGSCNQKFDTQEAAERYVEAKGANLANPRVLTRAIYPDGKFGPWVELGSDEGQTALSTHRVLDEAEALDAEGNDAELEDAAAPEAPPVEPVIDETAVEQDESAESTDWGQPAI